ncbi:fimbrial protein [Pseudomonas sp. nanlin1]|uniref:fimbrial protein n=1 Tax=Pseudomonas sp. nanlin1 TaxID=3040605 RepID=UPI00388EB238
MLNTLSKFTLACGATCLLASTASFADQGQIAFTGTVTDNACTISTADVSKSVALDPVRIADFASSVGSKAKPKKFSLNLENCSTEAKKNVAITFSGQPDATDATLLGLRGDSQVKGIAIQIDDSRDGSKVALNAPVNYALRNQSNTFDFTASYVRTVADTVTGSGDEAVTVSGIGTGQVNALATFDVTYR